MGRATGVVVVGTVALANASSYGFQLVTGRFLGADAYGLLAGLMQIIAIIGVSATSLQTVAARAVSADEVEHRVSYFDSLSRSAVVVGGGVSLVFLALTPLLSSFLKVGVLPLVMLAAFIVPSLLGAIAIGRLQGQMRFITMSLMSTVFAVTKLGVGVVSMAAGLGVTALIAGLVIASSACTAIAVHVARTAGAVTHRVIDSSTGRVFLGVTMFWLLVSIDVPFARSFFSESLAGQYAAADVIGRAVLWLPAVITQITFPQVSQAVSNVEKTERLMLRAFATSTALATAGVVGIYVFGEPVFRVLYGSEYPDAHRYAWKIALATVPYAIVNLLLHHHFARGHNRFVLVLVLAAVGEVLGLTLGPRSPDAFALTLGIVGSAAAIAMLPAGGWRFLSQLVLPSRRAATTSRNHRAAEAAE
jgi:O-antigen/teichoic acid export membrane protein